MIKLILDRFVDEIEAEDIKVIKTPPIESVNYGRDVGYAVEQVSFDDEIENIPLRALIRARPVRN